MIDNILKCAMSYVAIETFHQTLATIHNQDFVINTSFVILSNYDV